MEGASKRTWVIEQPVIVGPDGDLHLDEQFDIDRARVLLDRLLGALAEIGGMVALTVDRVKESRPGPGGKVLAVSERLIVEWQAFSPLREREDGPWEDPLGEAAEQEDEAERVADEQEEAVAGLEQGEELVVAGGDAWDKDAPPETEEPDQS